MLFSMRRPRQGVTHRVKKLNPPTQISWKEALLFRDLPTLGPNLASRCQFALCNSLWTPVWGMCKCSGVSSTLPPGVLPANPQLSPPYACLH